MGVRGRHQGALRCARYAPPLPVLESLPGLPTLAGHISGGTCLGMGQRASTQRRVREAALTGHHRRAGVSGRVWLALPIAAAAGVARGTARPTPARPPRLVAQGGEGVDPAAAALAAGTGPPDAAAIAAAEAAVAEQGALVRWVGWVVGWVGWEGWRWRRACLQRLMLLVLGSNSGEASSESNPADPTPPPGWLSEPACPTPVPCHALRGAACAQGRHANRQEGGCSVRLGAEIRPSCPRFPSVPSRAAGA